MATSSVITMSKPATTDNSNLFEGLIMSLVNKHAQLDLMFNRTNVKFPGTPAAMEINGSISLIAHMRELTDDEKQMLASRNVASLSSSTPDTSR